MRGVEWEMKSPVGAARVTVTSQLKRAAKQSKNVIFDARRTKIPDAELIRQINADLEKKRSIKRLLFIGKSSKVLEILPRKC
ncbi:MAG: hypothetical protein LBS17_04475 [Actinomycetes bacterium]|jgi:hypothetical protein|nr:hypothetical protein [Actinomycetes bacterium]